MNKYYILTTSLLISMLSLNVSASPKEVDEYCETLSEQREGLVEISTNDAEYYYDINPEKYLHEGKEIFRLSVINIKSYFNDASLKLATAEYSGDREDLNSEYCYRNGEISKIRQKYTTYSSPKWSDNYDENKKNETHFSMYFKSNKLIYLEKNGNPVEKNMTLYAKKSLSGTNDSNLILSIKR